MTPATLYPAVNKSAGKKRRLTNVVEWNRNKRRNLRRQWQSQWENHHKYLSFVLFLKIIFYLLKTSYPTKKN